MLLVGAMGLYEYRPYVKKIRNNRQIMYQCNRGHILLGGPTGATCIDGQWSPPQLPRYTHILTSPAFLSEMERDPIFCFLRRENKDINLFRSYLSNSKRFIRVNHCSKTRGSSRKDSKSLESISPSSLGSRSQFVRTFAEVVVSSRCCKKQLTHKPKKEYYLCTSPPTSGTLHKRADMNVIAMRTRRKTNVAVIGKTV